MRVTDEDRAEFVRNNQFLIDSIIKIKRKANDRDWDNPENAVDVFLVIGNRRTPELAIQNIISRRNNTEL